MEAWKHENITEFFVGHNNSSQPSYHNAELKWVKVSKV